METTTYTPAVNRDPRYNRFGHDFTTADGTQLKCDAITWKLKCADVQGHLRNDNTGWCSSEVNGMTISTPAGGTCDRCGQSIVVIVSMSCEHGVAHFGTDCADHLLGMAADRAAQTKVQKAAKAHTKAMAAARKVRKTDALVAASAELVARCEAIIASSPAGSFVRSLAHSIKLGISRGKAPSAKQIACLDRVCAEVAA